LSGERIGSLRNPMSQIKLHDPPMDHHLR
jgi:hypothetical protein